MPRELRIDLYDKAADFIVRQESTLFKYACEHDLGLTSLECQNIARTKDFQAALRNARNLWYKELATDSSRSRNAAVGQLVFAITKLLEAGQYDKAVAAIAQLAKLEGWTSDQANISVFNDLNAKDFEELRKKYGQKSNKTGLKIGYQ